MKINLYFVNLNNMETKKLTEEEYKFIFSRVPRLCLDFIVVKDKSLLLAQRDIAPSKGCWALPGGMLHKGETIKQGAERILNDEIGIKDFSMEMIGFIEFIHEIDQQGINMHNISIVFLVHYTNEEPVAKSQATEIKFFKEIPLNIHKEHGFFIEKNLLKILK